MDLTPEAKLKKMLEVNLKHMLEALLKEMLEAYQLDKLYAYKKNVLSQYERYSGDRSDILLLHAKTEIIIILCLLIA